SARFKGRQDLGYFTPESVLQDLNLSKKWHEVHQDLFEVHDSLVVKGLAYVITDEAQEKHPGRKVFTADGSVKVKVVADQFKNLMPGSRLTSIAVTANAREMENMIRKMSSDPHPSVQKLGGMFKEASLQVAPTLVKYAEKNEYLTLTKEGIGKMAESNRFQQEYPEIKEEGQLVKLVDYDHLSQEKFIAAALFQESNTSSFVEILRSIMGMSSEEKRNAIHNLLGSLGRHDVPIRSLEFAGNYLVEYPGMTYGDWREYKRHRMQTYAAKDLDVRWGYMIPPLAYEMDESKDFRFNGSVDSIKKVMGKVENLFNEVYKVDPQAAQYCVTRLHYRPAIAMFNTREAFHLINLRTGPTAHPFIRRIIWPLYDEIKKVHPILMDHLSIKMQSNGRPGRDFPWTV
ncbi:MAG TPA: FAD-dependent thymidylate synthase, partial [Alphaproteobacteria bacterium]|nr:FAD-dependent thymidylate synthase [Alphaproteobacteria bacterium]